MIFAHCGAPKTTVVSRQRSPKRLYATPEPSFTWWSRWVHLPRSRSDCRSPKGCCVELNHWRFTGIAET